MRYEIKPKISLKVKTFFVTGLFLLIAFSYELYTYLEKHEFIYEFPGDWDKPIGIVVGIFILFRSFKFYRKELKGLFIEITKSDLIFRTKHRSSVKSIQLSSIKKVKEEGNEIIAIIKGEPDAVVIDFKKVRVSNNTKKLIKASLLKLKSNHRKQRYS